MSRSQRTENNVRKSAQSNSFSILIVFFALSIAGLAFLPVLKLQRNPTRAIPQITVTCHWLLSSPQSVEQQITTPLEGVLSTVSGIQKMTSRTNRNSSRITLFIDKDRVLEKVRFEVATAIRRVYSKLPQEASYPIISLNNPDEKKINEPVLIYTLQGNCSGPQLRKYAETELTEWFHGIAGLGDIKVHGGGKKGLFLQYNQEKLQRLHLSRNDIIRALSQYLQRVSVGFSFEDSSNDQQISVVMQHGDADIVWSDVVIKNYHGRLIYLTDVCKIVEKQRQPDAYYRVNGLNAVNMIFYPSATANHIVLAKEIKNVCENINTQLPEKYSFLLSLDNVKYISNELSKIGWRSLFTVVILLLFVLIISLSVRYMTVIMISLVVNITLSFSFYYLFGINIHLYSLAGITISLGLIIDNSIVMIDHYRHFHNKKVYLALLASTLTTIASLSIVWLLPDKLKLTLLDFSYIIIVNLMVSLAVSLWFIPALLQQFPLRPPSSHRVIRRKRYVVRFSNMYATVTQFVIKRKRIMIIFAFLIFGIPVFWLPNAVNEEYFAGKIYNKTIGSDWYQHEAAPVVEKVLGGGLRLFVRYVYEGSHFRKSEETKLFVRAGLPKGGTLEQNNRVIKEIEAYLASFDEVKLFTTNISSPQSSFITIYFTDESIKNNFPIVLKGRLTQKVLNFGGMEWSIYGVGNGFYNGIGAPESINYRITLTGYNYDELDRQADNLKIILKKNPRTADVNTNMKYSWRSGQYDYVYNLHPNRDMAALYNVTLPSIFSYMQAFDQLPIPFMTINTTSKNSGLLLVSDGLESNDLYSLHEEMMPYDSVKLKLLMSITKEKVSPDIFKENQQYIRVVGYQYNGVYKFGNRLRAAAIEELNAQMPLGYKAKSRTGSYWSQKKQKPYHLLIIIFIMVFVIGAVLFESLRQPFSLIAMIPLSFVGVFYTFYLFDLNFDQGGYASFILLTGLVVNSAIYIINDYNSRMKLGVRAYIKAYNHKIIPILLTVISTILGLIPFILLGGDEPFWFAFAAGSIGGLIFSLPVLFFFLPVFLLKKK